MDASLLRNAPLPSVQVAPTLRVPFDTRWIWAVGLVVGLMTAGTLVAWQQGPSIWINFAAQVAQVYCPAAAVLILALGWTPRGYAVAAALFYGFLPLGQPASETYFLVGDWRAAITFEMALAVPLLLTAWLGPRAPSPREARAVPPLLNLAWLLLLMSGLVAAIMALDPVVGLAAFVSRFVLPVLVTLGTLRRLRGVQDAKIVWCGFAVGMAILTVYNIRRAVFGVVPWYQEAVNQRFIGASASFSIPTVMAAGPALWFGHALAIRKSPLHGVPWLLLAGALGSLLWLGGHRGPSVFFGLLVLWWLPGHFVKYMFHGKGLLITVLGVAAVGAMVMYFLTTTTLDLTLTFERLQHLWEGGITEEARWPLWMEALNHWLSSPLWGIGPNNWVVVNEFFESCHSSVFGLLIDVGLLGTAAFGLLLVLTFQMSRKSRLGELPPVDWEFFAGCRAAWVVLLLLLTVNLPFTSGQPKNSAFAYLVYFFPMLVMTVYTRYPAPRRQPQRAPFPTRAALPTPWPAGGGPPAATPLPRHEP